MRKSGKENFSRERMMEEEKKEQGVRTRPHLPFLTIDKCVIARRECLLLTRR